jgi:ribosomal protein L36
MADKTAKAKCSLVKRKKKLFHLNLSLAKTITPGMKVDIS